MKLLPLLLLSVCCWISVGAFVKRSAEEVNGGCMDTCKAGGKDDTYCSKMYCGSYGKKQSAEDICLENCAKADISPDGCIQFCDISGKKRSAEEQPMTYIIRQREGKRCSAECKDSEQKKVCERDCRHAAGVDRPLFGGGKRSAEQHRPLSKEEAKCYRKCTGDGKSEQDCIKECIGLEKRSAEEQPMTYIIRQRERKRCSAECKDSEQKKVCETECRHAAGVDRPLFGGGKRSAEENRPWGRRSIALLEGEDECYRKCRTAWRPEDECFNECAEIWKRSAEQHRPLSKEESKCYRKCTGDGKSEQDCIKECIGQKKRSAEEGDCLEDCKTIEKLPVQTCLQKCGFHKRSAEEEDCMQDCWNEGIAWNVCYSLCHFKKRSIEEILMKA